MSKASKIAEKAQHMQVPQLSAEDIYWAEVQSRVLARQAEIQADTTPRAVRFATEFEKAMTERFSKGEAWLKTQPKDNDELTPARADQSVKQHSESLKEKIRGFAAGTKADFFWSQRFETHGRAFEFSFWTDEPAEA